MGPWKTPQANTPGRGQPVRHGLVTGEDLNRRRTGDFPGEFPAPDIGRRRPPGVIDREKEEPIPLFQPPGKGIGQLPAETPQRTVTVGPVDHGQGGAEPAGGGQGGGDLGRVVGVIVDHRQLRRAENYFQPPLQSGEHRRRRRRPLEVETGRRGQGGGRQQVVEVMPPGKGKMKIHPGEAEREGSAAQFDIPRPEIGGGADGKGDFPGPAG